MKKLSNAATGRKNKTLANPQLLHRLTRNAVPLFFLAVLLGTFLFNSCKKQDINEPGNQVQQVQAMSDDEVSADAIISGSCSGLSKQTKWELLQVREATAKYRDISKAIADGYADINVVMQNMGYHYMKSALADAVFEIRKPELLVYNKNMDGSFHLVAVEYAVPLDLSPNAPPKGFTGAHDVWDHNTTFGLWTLHAWVWKNNPDGVFNPTNPLVHVAGASDMVSCAPSKK